MIEQMRGSIWRDIAKKFPRIVKTRIFRFRNQSKSHVELKEKEKPYSNIRLIEHQRQKEDLKNNQRNWLLPKDPY